LKKISQEEYQKSLDTGELQLSNWDKVNHYGVVGFLFFIPISFFFINLIMSLKDGAIVSFAPAEIFILIIPTVVGLLFYWLQKSRLKFKTVTTTFDRSAMQEIIAQVADELKWKPVFHNAKIYIATTNPGFFSRSWGERITVLIDHDSVLINSICDPEKHSSVVSMGRNRQNVNTLIDRLKETSK